MKQCFYQGRRLGQVRWDRVERARAANAVSSQCDLPLMAAAEGRSVRMEGDVARLGSAGRGLPLMPKS